MHRLVQVLGVPMVLLPMQREICIAALSFWRCDTQSRYNILCHRSVSLDPKFCFLAHERFTARWYDVRVRVGLPWLPGCHNGDVSWHLWAIGVPLYSLAQSSGFRGAEGRVGRARGIARFRASRASPPTWLGCFVETKLSLF